ncbi:3-oxoacyl-[acyl-carrier-protein] synthase III C-terminal domain-containing protein [Microtetraspora sp. NBRC 16547]|uniref:type III polyketide synthase n=1 Tax=Microtetraspora sp. NBRC 16547 TaxID=3030993 RepID=UPI0024A54CBE|nr:3-oxoacyl-[acyl-carrier-protein] synthase III C-terminal domain-containing protein [Microtetraspora sp. NBRC 16547]GLW99739.1 stilbene synthase [Microtetraspora sp. NBRC 16547]
MTRIAAVRCVLPPNRYAQKEITNRLAELWLSPETGRDLLDRLHTSTRVEYRHLALPIEEYGKLDGFGTANEIYIDAAVDLGTEAVRAALEAAGLAASDVDLIIVASTTGVAAPSLDARMAGRLGLRPDVKRLPIFGLGCVAGAAGIARLHDYLRGAPGEVAVLLAVELCSLTLQRGDSSIANLVASGLFGDGAAAVVACGDERPGSGPAVAATRSRLYRDSERVMGWDVRDSGFQVVLDVGIPELVRTHLADDVQGFLSDQGLTTEDVTAWVCHPGGPKVLEAVAAALDLPDGALDATWRSLAGAGNLSSASALFVLRDTLASPHPPPAGTPGVLLAMGPGFCSELVLLRW